MSTVKGLPDMPMPAYTTGQREQMITLKVLRELFLDAKLSETALRVAGASIIDHAIAGITGKPVESNAAIRWAMNRARDLGYIPQ